MLTPLISDSATRTLFDSICRWISYREAFPCPKPNMLDISKAAVLRYLPSTIVIKHTVST